MISSGVAAGLVAQVAFWAVMAIGVVSGELRARTGVVFAILWACGVFGLPRVSPTAGLFVTTYVAVLGIVLAFIVFKGDVRLR